MVAMWFAAASFIPARAELLFPEFIDPNPNVGNQFGASVVALSTGNVVITAPNDDAGGTDAGAVYLFNGATGALISTMTGSAEDNVGSDGVVALSNGNYVVCSPYWDNAGVVDAGAVTWGSGTSGVSGAISRSNSLVGTQANDRVGRSGVTVLSNGNYVVSSPRWDNAGVVDAGAVTWGNGTSGVSGEISSSNSLVGTTDDDQVGTTGVAVLTNGNYVVSCPYWDNAGVVDAGAVTWGSGTSGVSGEISSSNSLIGTTADDRVGSETSVYQDNSRVTALSNGNYVVGSPHWDNAGVMDAGAVTWGSGTSGVSGEISSSNSLVGTTADDQVGNTGVTELTNGNYVAASPYWDNAGVVNAGAVTWGSGTSGVSGAVTRSNSLIGTTTGDYVGSYPSVTALSNGNYVVSSRGWDNAAAVNAGAVTWGSGTSGVRGEINSSNSLVGTKASDYVGNSGVTALSNGNYVVSSSAWDNAGVVDAGAVTWGSGTSGVSGAVTSSNSLVGTRGRDQVGGEFVTALTNGNYVVASPYWDNASVVDAGAVTWGSGTSGVSGAVTSSNSLVGTRGRDQVGGEFVTALTNGNYVVASPYWDNAGVVDAGAVTWGSGTSGVSGAVTSSNSLVGTKGRDQVGGVFVTALTNGNYVVASPHWDNAGVVDAGAVTWGSGTSGVSGAISSSNSLLGTTADDQVGSHFLTELSNGNYVVASPYWDNAGVVDAGAVTWGSGTSGVSGAISSSNSLVGTTADDQVGSDFVTALTNGNYVVASPYWDNASVVDAGAVTWGSGTTGVRDVVSSSNSLVGLNSDTYLEYVVVDDVNSTYFGRFVNEGAGKVRLGSQADGLSSFITVTAITPAIGSSAGGSSVTLTGTNFTGATDVTFGGTAATNVNVFNATTITCTIPAHPAGAVSVLVKNAVGTNAANTLFTYVVPAPDVAVAQGGHLTDGVSIVPHGSLPVGSSSGPLTFTITNPGTAELTGLSVTKDGPNAADFTVSELSATSIPVGTGTATFTVTFFASSGGARSAALHIASNLTGPKNPFDIGITGSGRIAGKASQIIVFNPSLKLHLAESPFTLSASTSSGLPVAFSLVSGPANVVGNVLTLTGAGTVKVRASQEGNADFLAASPVERMITVAANPTTLTLTNLIQTYTGAPCPITVLGATGAVDVNYKVGLNYVPTPPINAGSYPVKAVAGAITKTGSLIINKAPLYVQPDDQRKFAGQANPVLTYTITGYLGGDNSSDLTKAPVLATSATPASVGGVHPITAGAATALNYSFIYLPGTMIVESFAGNYEALLVDGGPIPVGKLSITVAATSKTFTAKLTTATEISAVSFSGPLLTVGEQATGNATTLVGTGKVPYRIDFTLPIAGNVIASATRSSLPLGSAADGRKLSAATVTYAGAHTAVLEPATPTGGAVPAGAGWATASISTTGVITLTGKLGDGTGFTSALNPDVESIPGYRLFVQPYITARTQSFLAGSFTLAEHPSLTGRRYLAQSSLTWKKTGLPTDVSYRTGFGPVNTVMMIDPWLAPKTTTPAITLAQRLGLTVTSFGVTHSATGSASQSNLPTRLSLSTTNVVSVLAPVTSPVNRTKWKTLTFKTTDGTFTGSFELSDAIKRPVTFSGILRQPATAPDTLIGEGHYLLPPLTGTEKTTGEVMFTRP